MTNDMKYNSFQSILGCYQIYYTPWYSSKSSNELKTEVFELKTGFVPKVRLEAQEFDSALDR